MSRALPYLRGAGRRLLAVALLLVWAGAGRAPAAQERALWLDVRGAEAFPFSTAELRAAVDARVPLATDPGSASSVVTVTGDGPGGPIAVASSFRMQRVPMAGKTPAQAARLVALAVLDVARSLPAPVQAAAPNAGSLAASAPPAQGRGALAVGLFPAAVNTGLGGGATFEPTLELSWRPPLRLGPGQPGLDVQLGFARTQAAWNGRAFDLQTLPARLGLRWRWRALEGGAGAVARLYRTRGLDGGSGAIAGGFAELRGALALGPSLQAVAAVGCDGYTERLEFRAAGLSLLRTGQVMPWMGLGVVWGTGR